MNRKILFLSEAWKKEDSESAKEVKKSKFYYIMSIAKLKDDWTIYQPESIQEVQEMTVEDVSKLLGKTVKIVEKKTNTETK